MAGVSWQAIHYLLGFQQLGWDVWYVEDSGAPPYDPRLGMNTEDCAHAVGYIADVMRRIGLPDRWAYVDLMHGATHGLPRARLDGLYRDAAAHVNFLRFLDLPRHAPGTRFQLAMDPLDATVEARLRAAGWELTDPRPISADVDVYRDFIYGSRGEFTVAKDIYVRPRSGWFSDRSVCYLAAGKPVVTQDTGFGKFVPTGQGLLAYSTMEEAVDALARVNRDYAAHGAAARRVAAEHFGAEPVLRRLLADAGLG